MNDIIYVGCDFSICSPALSIIDNNKIEHHCFHEKPDKFSAKNTTIHQYPIWQNQYERFDKISEVFLNILKCQNKPVLIGLEGFAMAGKGKVFNIAENTAVLKFKLYKNGYTLFEPFPPRTIKKFATGKGNATKHEMYQQFLKETGNDIHQDTQPKVKIDSAFAADIADSYFMAKYLKTNVEKLSKLW